MKGLFSFLLLFGFSEAFATMPTQPQNCAEILSRPQFDQSMSKVKFNYHDTLLPGLVSHELANAKSPLYKKHAVLETSGLQFFHQVFHYRSTINGFVGPSDTILLQRFYKDSGETQFRILEANITVTSLNRMIISANIQRVSLSALFPLEKPSGPVSILITVSLGRAVDIAELKTLLARIPVTIDDAYGLITIDPAEPLFVARALATMADVDAINKVPGLSAYVDSPITTQAIGEEGIPPLPSDEGPLVTTQAIGEEGTPPLPSDEGPLVTTQAIGEEGTPPLPSKEGPLVTTQAIGEEGAPWRPSKKN